MNRILTTFCLLAATMVTVATGECLAGNSARGVDSGYVQSKAGDLVQSRGKVNADQTEAGENFLSQSSRYLGLKGKVLP